MMKESKAIIAINESTKEVKKFRSINEAARELNSTFCAIQGAFFRGGSVKGWKIYGSPDMIQSRIDELKKERKKIKPEDDVVLGALSPDGYFVSADGVVYASPEMVKQFKEMMG